MLVHPTGPPVLGDLRTASVPTDQWEELTDCPVCGRHDFVEDIASIEGGPVLAACLDCEHLFKRRRPRAAWLDEYYAHDWDAVGRDEAPAVPAPRTKIVDYTRSHLPAGAKVLDMGAGYGRDLIAFRDAGYEAIGLESSEHRAQFIRDVVGLSCVTGPFESADLPEGLDLVFSNHVMEHITDPADVVARAAEVLREGGLWYGAMPNGINFEHPLQFVHYVPHQTGFTRRSLARLLERHGFEVVDATETRELQMLARLTGGPTVLPEGEARDREAFRERLRAWVADGFGTREGNKTLVWWRGRRSPTRCYEGTVVPGGRPGRRVVDVARATHARLPLKTQGQLKRFLPPARYVRVLSTRNEGRFDSLPVSVRYRDDVAIWLK